MAFNDLKIPISIANRYHVLLVGPEGEIKQESISHNTICQNMFSNDAWQGNDWSLRKLQLGSGTGTPSISDTKLFQRLWGVDIQKASYDLKYPTSTIHMTFEVPAKSSYVGTITELGLGQQEHLMTHALLSDAEGQPMSIDKTDIDRLIVDVDLFITVTASEPIHLPDSVQNMDFVCNLCGRATDAMSRIGSPMGSLYKNVELSTSIKAAQLNQQHRSKYVDDSGAHSPRSVYNTHYGAQLGACTFGNYNNRKMILTTKRIAQDLALTDDIYFKGLTILGWGYIPFPNHDVFPAYTIENIKIGVGDGETSIYKNPLAYFIPNTEEIKVNGVLLTRDVDYTIEAHNNANMYVELSPCNEAIISGGYQAQCKYYPEAFRRPLSTGDNWGDDARMCTHSINKDNPIFIDMLESVTCNAIRIPQFWGAGTYELFYSEDGEEYISVTTLSKPNTTAEVHTIFDPITARYWKLTTTTTSTGTSYNFNQPKAYCAFLGYVGDGNITFTNPPAEDAEILMKVDMDLPYKNSNWVIDISAEFTI